MTTVRDLTDPYLDTFPPVPPTAEGVCNVCHGAPNPGWATCWSCDRTVGQVSLPITRVAPITLCEPMGQVHHVLCKYKDGPPELQRRFKPRVAALLGAFCSTMPEGVGAVGHGAPFGAAQRAGVGRLGQVRVDPNALELFGDEPPAGGGLQREAGLLWVELVEPGAQLQAGGGAELPAAGLAGRGVEVVVGDLAAVDVEPSYDGHRDLLWLPRYEPDAASVPHRSEGVPLTCLLLRRGSHGTGMLGMRGRFACHAARGRGTAGMVRVRFFKVQPERLARLRAWMAELAHRHEKVQQTFRQETVRHELAYLIQGLGHAAEGRLAGALVGEEHGALGEG